MGAGKSTIGKPLAKRLNLSFVDLDCEVEAVSGKKITALFEEQGEETFRQLESDILRKKVQVGNVVIATGGGVVEREENRSLLKKNGVSIFLYVDWEILKSRLSATSDRPLVNNAGSMTAVRQRYERRIGYYREAAIVVDCGKLPPEQIVDRIIADLSRLSW